MNYGFSRLGAIFTGFYLLLFLVALIFAKLTIKDSPLAAIYIMILTFPWSFIWGCISIIFLFLNFNIPLSTNIKFLLFTFFAIINTIILYYFLSRKENKPREPVDENKEDKIN